MDRSSPRRPPRRWRCLLPAAALIAAPIAAMAVEAPPSATAVAVLGAQATGSNYVVESEVDSDGFMHLFRLRTRSGSYEVRGDALMRTRLRELDALRRLNRMSESDVFTRTPARAAGRPVPVVPDVINDPAEAPRSPASGIATLFDRAGAALSSRNAQRDDSVSSLLAVDMARRHLAYQLGVDPYTDFPPLAARLNDIARASVAAGLTVQALVAAIPGAAGTAAGAAAAGERPSALLRDQTVPQIIDRVQQTLGGLGVSPLLAARLMENRNYTPSDLLAMAMALRTLRARNTSVFVARVAEAVARDEAYFHRRRAELLARHGRALGIVEFVSVEGITLNRTREGRLAAVFPFDLLSWTPGMERAFNAVTAQLRGQPGPGPILAMTGRPTQMSERELASLGWTVRELQ